MSMSQALMDAFLGIEEDAKPKEVSGEIVTQQQRSDEAIRAAFVFDANELGALANELLELRIDSGEDRSLAYGECKKGLSQCVKLRNRIEKTRKEQKAESLRIGKLVDSVASSFQSIINPAEEHLKAQCKIVEDEAARKEAERLRIEREAAEAAERQRRALEEAERKAERERVEREHAEQMAEARKQAEKERIAREAAEAEQRAERERLEKIHAEQMAEAKRKAEETEHELAEARRVIQAERDRIAAEERKRQAEEAEKRRLEAAEAERNRLAEEAEKKRLEAEQAERKKAEWLEQTKADQGDIRRISELIQCELTRHALVPFSSQYARDLRDDVFKQIAVQLTRLNTFGGLISESV